MAFWKRISSPQHLNLEPMLYQVIDGLCRGESKSAYVGYSACCFALSCTARLQSMLTGQVLLDSCRSLARGQTTQLICGAVQLSIMRILHKVLTDRRAHRQPAMAELLRFATTLVRSLLARLVPSTQATGTGNCVVAAGQAGKCQRLEAA